MQKPIQKDPGKEVPPAREKSTCSGKPESVLPEAAKEAALKDKATYTKGSYYLQKDLVTRSAKALGISVNIKI